MSNAAHILAVGRFILFTVLLALLCRRALGVPVGWTRSVIIVGGALYLTSGPVLLALFSRE